MFIDATSDETLLRIDTDLEGVTSFTYRLYNSDGTLARDSEGPHEYPLGAEIRSADDELLLFVPVGLTDDIRYRLYAKGGKLITCSDGKRTQILLGLRVEGNAHLPGRPPVRPTTPNNSANQ